MTKSLFPLMQLPLTPFLSFPQSVMGAVLVLGVPMDMHTPGPPPPGPVAGGRRPLHAAGASNQAACVRDSIAA